MNKIKERKHDVSSYIQIKYKTKELTMKKYNSVKEMKKRYAMLRDEKKSMTKYFMNYEQVLKLLTDHVGYMGENLDEGTKNQLLWLLKEKNKLEKNLLLNGFEMNLLDSKIKKLFKGVIENDLMDITIYSCNRDLAEYEIEEDTIIQCGSPYKVEKNQAQVEFKFYPTSKREKLTSSY